MGPHLGQKYRVQAVHFALISAVFCRHWWQVVPFSLSYTRPPCVQRGRRIAVIGSLRL